MRKFCAGAVMLFALLLLPQSGDVAGRARQFVQGPDFEVAKAIGDHDAIRLGQFLDSGKHPSVDVLLDLAIERCDVAIVRLLLTHGANPNSGVNGPVQTPLIGAARLGCWEITDVLLTAGADPNGRAGLPTRVQPPLYTAAYYGHRRVVASLLSAGANPNGRVDRGGPTPLMEAARHGDVTMAEWLIRKGADANLTDEKNRRAIDYLKEHQNDVDRIATMLRQTRKR